MDILLDAFKNLYRRKSRSLLAVIGVSTGVFAFLIMGAMAEHFSRISRQFEDLFHNRIFICERMSFWAGGGILSEAKVEKIEKVKGIENIIPLLISRKSDKRMIVVGLPRVVVGVPPSKLQIMAGQFKPGEGRLSLPDENSAVVGFDISRDDKLTTGNQLEIRKKNFKITGILEKTGGLYDGQIFVPLKTAQKLYNREGLLTSILVIPAEGIDPEKLAENLKENVKGVEVVPPSMLKNQIKSSLSLWNSLTLGAALTAALAGALCVIITMLVSVSERFVEIGLKKAIGATTAQVMMEFLTESVIVTLAGWVLGALMGIFFVKLTGNWLNQIGSNLFDLTGRLYLAALLGSLFLGFLAGLYPAYRAATIEPAKALKVRY